MVITFACVVVILISVLYYYLIFHSKDGSKWFRMKIEGLFDFKQDKITSKADGVPIESLFSKNLNEKTDLGDSIKSDNVLFSIITPSQDELSITNIDHNVKKNISEYIRKYVEFNKFELIDASRNYSNPNVDSLKSIGIHMKTLDRYCVEKNDMKNGRCKYIVNGTIMKFLDVNKKIPFLFSQSEMSLWNESQSFFDLWELSIELPIIDSVLFIDNVLNSHGSTFLMEEDNVDGLLTKVSPSFQTSTSMEIMQEIFFADFLLEMKNISRSYFFSTDYRVMESMTTLKGLIHWDKLRISHGESTSRIISPAPLFNILSSHSSLQARYSEYETMIIQLKGQSRLFLFSPNQMKNLYLFPSIHSAKQQSQINLNDINSTSRHHYPKFYKNLKSVVEFVLEPGDVVYVPSYWLVHSTAIGVSVTLDVLSVSDTQFHLSETYYLPLPFNKSEIDTTAIPGVTAASYRIVAAQVYLIHVLSRLKGLTTIKKFSRSLYLSRFASLYPEASLFIQSNPFQCLKDTSDVHSKIIERMDKDRIITAAEKVAERLNHPMINKSVRWIWMGNYVEQIARWAMQDPNQVVFFIRECLDMDSKIEVIEWVEGPKVLKLDTNRDKQYDD